MSAESYIKMNYPKFVDVVHYICEQFSDNPDALGQTKLHKILYFSDMVAFFERGEPLTGVEYQKQPRGPTARYLAKAIKDLEKAGKLTVSTKLVFGYKKAEFCVTKPLSSNQLSEDDKELIDAVCRWASGMTAVEISEFSHMQPWAGVKQGERIDYITAGLLFPRSGPTDSDRKWAEEAARTLVEGSTGGPD